MAAPMSGGSWGSGTGGTSTPSGSSTFGATTNPTTAPTTAPDPEKSLIRLVARLGNLARQARTPNTSQKILGYSSRDLPATYAQFQSHKPLARYDPATAHT